MATFCYDHYEHPVLWCEEKKRLIEKRNAEESMRIWRRKKAEEMARRERDKQEYYDMYLKHCPWGRPGGGAPNVDIRRRDITSIGLHSTPAINTMHRMTSLQPQCKFNDYYSPKKCGQPHVTAENRHSYRHHNRYHHHSGEEVTCEDSSSGPCNAVTIFEKKITPLSRDKDGEQLRITVKDRHQPFSYRKKNHIDVDIEVRYKPAASLKDNRPKLEKISTASEYDQGGKASEETTKSPKKKPKARIVDKQRNKEAWEKPAIKTWKSPKSLGSSFMKSLGWTNKEMMKELDQDNPVTPAEKPFARKIKKKIEKGCSLYVCKCPVKCLNECKLNQEKCDVKPLCPRLGRHCLMKAHLPSDGIELVPLLARRRALNRPICLSSTDVTKRTTCDNRFTSTDARYLNDLNSQISEKHRSISLSQQMEKELSSKHFETFDKFWGRPGHGAPSEIKTKLKLDNLLYGIPSSAQ